MAQSNDSEHAEMYGYELDAGETSDVEDDLDGTICIDAPEDSVSSAERVETEEAAAEETFACDPAGDEPEGSLSHLPDEIRAAGWNEACELGADGKWRLPSGVTMLPGTGLTRRHEETNSEFNYGKEVDTKQAGRKHATAENLLPNERKSKLSMRLLKKIGFKPNVHLQDPLWFLLLLLPITTYDVMGKNMKGSWTDHEEETNAYAVKERKLGGSRRRKFILRTVTHMIRWWGVVYMDGVLGGSNGNIGRRFDKESECFNDKIYEAFKDYGGKKGWLQTKSVLKMCDNYAKYADKSSSEYNPAIHATNTTMSTHAINGIQ